MFSDASPKLGDSDNNLLFKIAQSLSDSASSGGFLTQALADARYVNVAGDTMTGSLNVANGAALVASDPAIDISQTWNNAGATFQALRVSVTNTASGVESKLVEALVDGVSKFSVQHNSTLTVHRQEDTNSGAAFLLSKRGAVGSATAAVVNGAGLSAVDTQAWDGTSQSICALVRVFALEDFTNTAHGCQIVLGTAAIGGTSVLTRLSISATAIHAQNGAAYFLNGAGLLHPLSVYATGTAYTLTNVSAGVDFGTVDPILTINVAGTYRLKGRVKVNLNGATFAANQTLTVKLRRTNNTPADVASSNTTWTTPIVTTVTNTLAVIELPEVPYTTANTDDTIQIFADISVVPSAGTITIAEASITAFRTS